MTSTEDLDIVLRPAVPADAEALNRLAALDSLRLPAGPYVVAERGGTVVAAMAQPDGTTFADPFVPTADIVALLRRWEANSSDRRPRSRRLRLALAG